eukprot:66486-Pleurochrysis_carterae.AAC.1
MLLLAGATELEQKSLYMCAQTKSVSAQQPHLQSSENKSLCFHSNSRAPSFGLTAMAQCPIRIRCRSFKGRYVIKTCQAATIEPR